MKTLDEVMAGVTPLPWKELTVHTVLDQPGRSYSIRAANTFPALVRFVEAQECECDDWANQAFSNTDKPVKCPRCALLEEVLR